MSNRRYQSGLARSEDDASRSNIRRTHTEPTTPITDNLLAAACEEGLEDIPDGGAPELALNKAELESLRADLLGSIKGAEQVCVKNPTVSSPARSIEILCRKLNLSMQKAVKAYLNVKRPDMSGGKTLADIWEPFAADEVALSGRPREHLVCPSGDFGEPLRLFVQWHYPTFNTKQLEYMHTADTTNPCTNMMLKVGVNPITQPLGWGERWHRRESTKDREQQPVPMSARPQAELDLADNFNTELLELANAKIVLLLGIPAQKWYETKFKPKSMTVIDKPKIQLWANFDQGKNGTVFQRLAVPCPHPEAIFFDSVGRGRQMDECIRFAVELAGLEIPLDTTFFARMEDSRIKIKKHIGFPCGPRDNKVDILVKMLAFEHQDGSEKIPWKAIPSMIRDLFHRWTGQPASETAMNSFLLPLCPEWHVSLVKGLHILLCQRASGSASAGFALQKAGNAVQQTRGWPALDRGRATQLAADPTMSRARAAHDAQGRPGIQKSIDVNRQQGYANLAKGRETMSLQAEARRRGEDPSIVRSSAATSWSCDECEKSFNTKQAHSQHMQVEHQGKRYECEWAKQGRGCTQKPYKGGSGLRKHIATRHKGQKYPPE
ncbi:uncharacterized protein HMPREF1541_07919 [Cyphellophora europaea CBS 101466]|uniref:C2H2-type domain-containing protein n=1 Tax=Cyphellophora europaea (strain CBS 101466) TaxID=1220924 RepID=W2RKC9_CYPE1|nr:uncharacterized protein HMPREF1541_07919 [Cyphellophora europaea CBS 101466]ETN36932.1 hypothetical protein HMPREF1541_07919 [Cyphellophora europaea CBS 101466]